MEVWKPIKGYEGKYIVSNKGNVMNCRTGNVLKPFINKGYHIIVLRNYNGKPKSHLIHRLVAHAFIPKQKGFNEINHINEIKTDNRVENLEWIDNIGNIRKYYENHPHKPKRQPYIRHNTKYFNKPIIQFDLEGNKIKEWKNVATITSELGYHGQQIIQCCNNVKSRHTAFGYKWQYAIDIQNTERTV